MNTSAPSSSAQAGFTKTIDTEYAFRNALRSRMDWKLLPPQSRAVQEPVIIVTSNSSNKRAC